MDGISILNLSRPVSILESLWLEFLGHDEFLNPLEHGGQRSL